MLLYTLRSIATRDMVEKIIGSAGSNRHAGTDGGGGGSGGGSQEKEAAEAAADLGSLSVRELRTKVGSAAASLGFIFLLPGWVAVCSICRAARQRGLSSSHPA